MSDVQKRLIGFRHARGGLWPLRLPWFILYGETFLKMQDGCYDGTSPSPFSLRANGKQAGTSRPIFAFLGNSELT